MKLKLVFATATAVGLLMATGAVYAGSDNQSTVNQSGGNNNNALVLQSTGSHNSAGTTSYNQFGFLVESDGSNNDIYINQVYDANSIGKENTIYKDDNTDAAGYGYGGIDTLEVAPYTIGQHGLSFGHSNGILGNTDDNYVGVWQNGNNNKLSVTQVGALGYGDTAGNDIVGVQQNGYAGATDTTNSLSITQTNNGARAFNWVGVVKQTNLSGYQGSLDNSIVINQTGGGFDLGNRVFVAVQEGYNNKLNIGQTGTNNVVTTVEQDGGASNNATITQTGSQNWVSDLAETGSGNNATILQSGNRNEVAALTMVGDDNGLGNGYFTGDAASVLSNGYLATVTQTGDDNFVRDTMTGSSNEYAFLQVGNLNVADGYVSGSSNQVASYQNGNGNSFKFGQEGTGNNIGISQ